MSNVLVLGNGFDLAHGLKTSYRDFVDFLKCIETFRDEGDISTELIRIINSNGFIRYVLNENDLDKEFWTDLEELLLLLTEQIHSLFNLKIDNDGCFNIEQFNLNELSNKIIEHFDLSDLFLSGLNERIQIDERFYSTTYGIRWQTIREQLKTQLEELKTALIIYLKYYMQDLSRADILPFKQIRDIDPESIISFNYTKTYEQYDFNPKEIIHVHGNVDEGKIVLGYNDINEDDLDLIDFKKYYQRLKNKHPSIYSSKYLKPSMDNPPIVFIYGLSLDKKDEDLIRHIINNSKNALIFYSEEIFGDYERKLVNLISVFGKEVFLKELSLKEIVFVPIEKDKV